MDAVTWGKPVDGLRLGLSTAGNSTVQIHLENVGGEPMEVLSHVNAGEKHLDWYTLILKGEKGETRTLRFLDDRNRSVPIRLQLEPGSSLRHEVDVTAWAIRAVNSRKALVPGAYQARAVYEVKSDDQAWTGHIEAGPVALRVSPKKAQ